MQLIILTLDEFIGLLGLLIVVFELGYKLGKIHGKLQISGNKKTNTYTSLKFRDYRFGSLYIFALNYKTKK